MPGISDTVVRFFEQEDWSFSQAEESPMLQMAFRGDNGNWLCYAEPRDQFAQFVFYSVCPANALADKRLAAAEFLTRANYGLVLGNFELDMDDGEIRYKTSVDVGEGDLSVDLVRSMVYMNVLMMDRYLPGIMATIYSSVSPADAIAQIEESAD